MKKFLLSIGFAGCALAMLAAQRPATETRPPRQDYNSGEYFYRVFCASCHGSRGRGDGALADVLRVAPTDLTSIARRNNRVFPQDRVFAAIDGRQSVRSHSPGEMPVWGDVLSRTEGQNEAVVRSRINTLVSYLESLQSTP
jgi:mono/diheme cytochrome c family protein